MWRPAVSATRLHPGDLLRETIGRPIGLHIDRALDAGAAHVGEIFRDRIIAPDRFVGPEDARLHRACEPRQIVPAPDVVMGVDDLLRHRIARPPAYVRRARRRCPPLAILSTNGRIALIAAVSGRKRGSSASGVSHGDATPGGRSFRTASAMRAWSPRSSPSERTRTTAPRAKPAKRGWARNASSAAPIRVPPSQSATSSGGLRRALSCCACAAPW